jgi:uronate dehydrogenase
MKVLFVGATGIVGQQVVPTLVDKYELTLTALGGGEIAGLPVIDLDITNFEAVEKLFKAGAADGQPFDAIVNCAIANHRGIKKREVEDRRRYYESCIEVNARGAYHICEAAARASIPRIVYISSLTAVTGAPRRSFIDETSRDQPNDVYAACKVFGEHVGRYYAYRPEAEGNSVRMLCLRLGQPYRSFSRWDDTWHEGDRGRALATHADDIAGAIDRALQVDVQYGVYSITSDSDNPWIDPKVNEELGYKPIWKFTREGLVPINRPEGDTTEVIPVKSSLLDDASSENAAETAEQA